MRGYNYILTDPTRPGLVKIGFTDRDPRFRIQELKRTATPVPLELEYEMLIEDARQIEQRAHRMLGPKRAGKEWFRCSVEEAIQALRRLADSKAEMEKYYKQNREKVSAADAKEQARITAPQAEEAAAQAEKIALEKAKLSAQEKSTRAHRFNESAKQTFTQDGDVSGQLALAILFGGTALLAGFDPTHAFPLGSQIVICIVCSGIAVGLIIWAIRKRNRARVVFDRAKSAPESMVSWTPLEQEADKTRRAEENRIAHTRSELYEQYLTKNQVLDNSIWKMWGGWGATIGLVFWFAETHKWSDSATGISDPASSRERYRYLSD